MELPNSIATVLCKQCAAAGLPKGERNAVTNQVAKWYRSCGVEWTVERLKSMHQWYIEKDTDSPTIPPWVAHHKDGPKGPFRSVFHMKNRQSALAILSIHTAFYHEEVSTKQREKLLDGLNSKEVPNVLVRKDPPPVKVKLIPKLRYTSPTLQCLTKVSIPGHLGEDSEVYSLRNPTRSRVANAYQQSWFNIPNETARFLRNAGLTKHAPEVLLDRDYRVPIGTLACLQEPSLKARWISNPNRITQHFLRPLGEAWALWLESFPTDCTKNQVQGLIWAGTKLRDGVKLASVDLTSATDRLNLIPCLDTVHRRMIGNTFSEVLKETMNRFKISDRNPMVDYCCAVKHFSDISRGEWIFEGKPYAWSVGWPLGTRPSFPLLALTNNIVAMQSAIKAGLPWKDSFRVQGDDIVMDARLAEDYSRRIEALGGVVNPTKTIVSDKAAEFAGHVIDRRGWYLKRIKAREISDDSFMEVMSLMGDQAKWLLKHRQRRVWEELKYVPGFVLGGPRSRESHGEPLALRIEWYERHVARPEVKPDPVLLPVEQMAIQMVQALKEADPLLDLRENAKWFLPRDIWEGVQPSKTAYMKVQDSSDPRKKTGLSLEVAEAKIDNPSFVPYQTFKDGKSESSSDDKDDGPPPASLTGAAPPAKVPRKKRRGR